MSLFLKKLQRQKANGSPASNQEKLDNKVADAHSQELESHREKRFLMERQAAEKQERLATLIASLAPEKIHWLTYPAARVFFLAESIREERQYLGTDISKLTLIERRLKTLGQEAIESGTTQGSPSQNLNRKLTMCRQMIQSNLEELRKSQNLLRNVLGEINVLEERTRDEKTTIQDLLEIIQRVEDVRKKLSELPEGLRNVAKTTGEQAQSLFKESTHLIADEELHKVWKEQTSLDLFSSKHRPGGRSELLKATDEAIAALKLPTTLGKGFSPHWETDHRAPKEPAKPEEEWNETKEIDDEIKGDLIGVDFEQDKPSPNEANPKTQTVLIEVEIPETNSFEQESPQPTVEEKEITEFEQRESLIPDSDQTEAINETPDQSEAEKKENTPDEGYRFESNRTYLFEFPPKTPSITDGYRFNKGESDEAKELDKAPTFDPEATLPSSSEETRSYIEQPWVPPLDLKPESTTEDRNQGFNPFASVQEVEIAASPGVSKVIFRSDNPEIWNTTIDNGPDNHAIELKEIPGRVNWLGLKRIDTGEEVFIEITKKELQGSGEGKSAGFNGTNEYFYGARHLGLFSEECSTEVETRFTYGGWGFGHLSTSEGEAPEQICGWNGQRISNGTVFEITVYEKKPERVRDDQIIL